MSLKSKISVFLALSALVISADAAIVLTDASSSDRYVGDPTPFMAGIPMFWLSDGSFELDINNDSVTDFTFTGGSTLSRLEIEPEGDNRIQAFTIEPPPDDEYLLLAIFEGEFINQDALFDLGWVNEDVFISGTVSTGIIGDTSGGFLGHYFGQHFIGVEFLIEEQTHYGWIEFYSPGFGGVMTRWAYETEPGVGIEAGAIPEPSSLIFGGLAAILILGRKIGLRGIGFLASKVIRKTKQPTF